MIARNPFDSIYVSEEVDPAVFVDLFSPLLVHDTLALFEPGNVILMGTQGSGKSMLLNLLKPETQVAYARADSAFPLKGMAKPFVGCGVNLLHCGAMDFGQRSLPSQPDEGASVVAAYFADFLNYWIIADLLRSVSILASTETSRDALRVRAPGADEFDAFAVRLAASPCWEGGLGKVESFGALEEALAARIKGYRSFLNYNSDRLDPAIVETKTSAGEPIAVASELLRKSGLVGRTVEVFVRIDQYEDLGRLERRAVASGPADDNVYGEFTAVVHRMLGVRDPRVSYRIGTRRHAWPEEPRMRGTSAVLEQLRNYKLLDLDHLLRRQEHSRDQFKPFVEDVFARRLASAGYHVSAATSSMREVFGKPLTVTQLVDRYAPTGASDVIPAAEHGWPDELANRVRALADEDPLEAILAEAWFRQQQAREEPLTVDWHHPPWRTKVYWRKERQGQALLQLAARKRQRMIWCGDKTIRDLAGSNVLAFVSLCQSVFDAWLRTADVDADASRLSADESDDEPQRLPLPPLSDPEYLYLQDQAVREASEFWYRKIESDPDGGSRLRFVDLLGRQFREWLRTDPQMSYPGHNGFSVEVDELRGEPRAREILNECVAFGVLDDRYHTTRNKKQGRRQKWYLNPIYAPHFQIPIVKTKEPRYVSAAEVAGWLIAVGALEPKPTENALREDSQMQLEV